MKKIKIPDIFQNSKYIRYKILLMFIQEESEYIQEEPGKIKLKHLRYLLCKDHGLRLNHLPPSERNKMKYDNELNIRDIVKDEYKFPNAIRLSEALRKLIELGLVEKTPDKCYKITPLGVCEWDKDFIFDLIDSNFPSDPYEASDLTTSIKSLLSNNWTKPLKIKYWEE